MQQTKHCKNCQTVLTGAYCNVCGQRDLPAGITMRQVIGDFFSYSFSIEGPFVHTMRMLATNPGKLFRDYIDGVRVAYYKPIQFFLVATFVYLILAQLTGFDPLEGQFENTEAFEGNERMSKLIAVSKLAAEFLVANLNNFLFLLAFTLAAMMKLFHWRKQTLAEFLVIGFYTTGVYILLTIFTVLLALMDVQMSQFKFFLLLAYFSFAYSSFLEGFTIARILRGLVISMLSLVLYILLAFGISVCVVLVRG